MGNRETSGFILLAQSLDLLFVEYFFMPNAANQPGEVRASAAFALLDASSYIFRISERTDFAIFNDDIARSC
jgi:hypothetical protein